MSDITFFAQTTFRNQMRKFGIKTDDRRRHMYLIGKTGMGKSTILENMIVDDIRNGHGVAVVDPHGDLAEKVIEFVPPERIKDVIYFNPSDIDFPIAFNVVEQVEPHLRHLVASGLIGVFQKLWADSWGPRLEYILRNAILAILDYPGSTLLGVVRILSDKPFRKKVISIIQDPVVKAFWEKEFASYADKFASEAVSPIQNKVGQFLSTAFMRNIIGQTSSALDMRKIMDEGKILIMNLSKGRIGEDNSALLGAMMITKIQLAAMSRVDITERDRKDFFLYIDEFQNFSTDSFANILSEARKYHLCLIMAHQYVEQLDEKVRAAVFGNVGTMILFRVGAADAEFLVKEFSPTFTEEDIVNLPKYELYLRLMIDGVASDPFSAKGLPPLMHEERTNNVDKIIEFSRATYATPKATVEEKILRWHENFEGEDEAAAALAVVPVESQVDIDTTSATPKTAAAPATTATSNVQAPSAPLPPPALAYAAKPKVSAVPAKPAFPYNPGLPVKKPAAPLPQSKPKTPLPTAFRPATPPAVRPASPLPVATPTRPQRAFDKSDTYKFEAKCAGCGQVTKTPFEPDGIRPVYCKVCLDKERARRLAETEQRKLAKQAELENVNSRFQPFARPSTPEAPEKPIENAPVEPGPSISLGLLKDIKPVDFRGREIDVRPSAFAGDGQEEVLEDPTEEDLADNQLQKEASATKAVADSIVSTPNTVNEVPKDSIDVLAEKLAGSLQEGEEIRFQQ